MNKFIQYFLEIMCSVLKCHLAFVDILISNGCVLVYVS